MSLRIHTVPVLGCYAVVEVEQAKPIGMFAPLFPTREDALVFRCWIEVWRETYPCNPPVNVQEDVAEALRQFAPGAEWMGDILAPSDILAAFLASQMGRDALGKAAAA